MARRNPKASKTNRKARTSKEALRSKVVATPAPAAVESAQADAEPTAPEPISDAGPGSGAPNSARERVTVPEIPVPQAVLPQAATDNEDNGATAPRASLDALDEAFFQQAEAMEEEARVKMESFPPVAEDLSAQAKIEPPSPAVLARRGKFRKLVAAVVAAGALFVVGGIGKSLVSRSAVAAEPKAETAAIAAVAPIAEPVAEPVAAPAAKPVAPPEPKTVAQPLAAPEPVAPATTAEPEAPAANQAMAGVEDPRGEALKLLNRGKMKEAIPMASAAIQQEPDHALGYLYLGAALQDSGKHRDAIAAYSDCVRNAKKGPVWECRAMGGRP